MNVNIINNSKVTSSLKFLSVTALGYRIWPMHVAPHIWNNKYIVKSGLTDHLSSILTYQMTGSLQFTSLILQGKVVVVVE